MIHFEHSEKYFEVSILVNQYEILNGILCGLTKMEGSMDTKLKDTLAKLRGESAARQAQWKGRIVPAARSGTCTQGCRNGHCQDPLHWMPEPKGEVSPDSKG